MKTGGEPKQVSWDPGHREGTEMASQVYTHHKDQGWTGSWENGGEPPRAMGHEGASIPVPRSDACETRQMRWLHGRPDNLGQCRGRPGARKKSSKLNIRRSLGSAGRSCPLRTCTQLGRESTARRAEGNWASDVPRQPRARSRREGSTRIPLRVTQITCSETSLHVLGTLRHSLNPKAADALK